MGTEPGGIRREGESPTWFLGRSIFCVYMGCLLEFRARIKHTQCWGREIRSGGSVRSTRHGAEGRGGRRQCSMTELGMRLKDWVWGSRVRGEDLQFAHLVPQLDSLLLSYSLQKSSRTFQAVCPLLSANGSHFVKLLSPITLHWQLLLRLLRDLFSPETCQSPIPLEMCPFE